VRGYIALFGIAVETGAVMVVYLYEALDHQLKSGVPLHHEDIEAAVRLFGFQPIGTLTKL